MTLTAWKPEHYKAPGETVYLHVGIFPSNTWIGASRAYGRVFRPHTLTDDDTVVVNAGGLFVATDGQVYAARFLPDPNHLFTRGGRDPDRLPATATAVDARPFNEMGARVEPAHESEECMSWPRFGSMDVLNAWDQ